MSERFSFPQGELRRRTVRGVVITASFVVLIDALVVLQGLIAMRVLGPRSIGLYGIASTAALSVIALKRVGLDEAFVQQEEIDQEQEFQMAFTLDLGLAVLCAVAIVVIAPVVAVLWRDDRLLALTASLAYLPVAIAMQAPLWVFFRRMEYARQRSLQAVQPAVAFVITVSLVLAGVGVWSIIIGQATGYLIAVAVGLRASPYRLKLRFRRDAAARYVRFSTPIFVTTVAALVIAQGQTLAFKLHGGLAAAGFITLAIALTRYVDRADQIVTSSIYPVICAIKEQTRQLEELFTKSNRATLLWVLPFSGAVVLFAPDLQRFVLGPRWHPAVLLLQGLAVATALGQLGFNWFSFYRAHGDNKPVAIEATVEAVAFLALAVPGLLIDGARGFVAGRILGVLLAVAVRRYFVARLLPGVRYIPIIRPALQALLLAVASVVAWRLLTGGVAHSAVQAVLALAIFLAVYGLAIARSEWGLLKELIGTVRRRPRPGHEPAG